ncbi:MAG: P-loop NTPase [Candidatus Hydrogenedentes bacterium]|nr:P-loop NTPase [Candidatus Hydrogenedentota bacterium]
MITEKDVLDSMRHIVDPDLGKDIVSLGFIKNLVIDGSHVRFTVELTTPACPVKETFRQRCTEAVMSLPGVESVDVTMGAMERKPRPGADINTLDTVDAVIAVSSCKGGVGKSTVAAHLARAMQRDGLAVGLLDADVYGPSMPTLFGIYHPHITMFQNKITPVNLDGLKLMSLGFLLGESPAVLRGPIVSNYIAQILRQTDWGKLDYLIIDMPPGTGDIQLTIVQLAALDGAIIVTTPQALSLVDVARGILMFEKVNVPVLGVVENMCSFTCNDCGAVHYPFGRSRSSLQERFGLTTLAELPIMPGVSDLSSKHAGADIAGFTQMSEQVHRAIGKSRVEAQERPQVTVAGNAIQVRWSDGYQAILSAHDVRCACPCAVCVDEYTGAKLLDHTQVPFDVTVESVQELGNYAVSFAWSDGHTTGIYSWEFLRALADREAGAAF